MQNKNYRYDLIREEQLKRKHETPKTKRFFVSLILNIIILDLTIFITTGIDVITCIYTYFSLK